MPLISKARRLILNVKIVSTTHARARKVALKRVSYIQFWHLKLTDALYCLTALFITDEDKQS